MATFTSEKDDQHYQYAMQLATVSVLPMALKAAVELGVLEIIERAGPGAMVLPSHIASQIPAQNNPHAPLVLDRILYLLASYSVLTCSVTSQDQDEKLQRLYGLAPVARYFLRNHDGGTLGPLTVMSQDKAMMDTWDHLKEAVLDGGRPFDKAHGMNALEFLGKNPEFGAIFKESMTGFNPLLMEELLGTYDGFQGLNSLVDVGGGDGSILKMIISKYPNIKGVNYDLAQVIEKSPAYPGIDLSSNWLLPKEMAILEAQMAEPCPDYKSRTQKNTYFHLIFTHNHKHIVEFASELMNDELIKFLKRGMFIAGIEHVAGDMFESVPKGDAIFMKWVVHMWDDEVCLKLLRNCYEALPANGKVIVVDMVVPEAPETSISAKSLLHFYLFMSSMTPGGHERTEREFGSLAKQAGFSHIRIAGSAYVFSVVEFVKTNVTYKGDN